MAVNNERPIEARYNRQVSINKVADTMERTVGSTGVGVEDSKVVDTIRVGTVVLRTLGD